MAEDQAQYYHHGPFQFASGSLDDAITAYRTHGDPKNPCIVFPTCFGGRLEDQSYFVGEGKTLDTSKYFVVTFGLFSGGESSSPSNTPAPFNGPNFPTVSYEDNTRAHSTVLTLHLGIKKVYCVVGFSMGGQAVYYWALMYPEIVERFVAICGSARTSPHNKCFLEGPLSALLASRDFESGNYLVNPEVGIRAFARWFREQRYLYNGKYKDLDSWIKGSEEAAMLTWDANDLVTLARTWSSGDISLVRDGGNYEQALKSIKTKGLVMPCKTDLYFRHEDSEIEVSHLTNSKLIILDSIWGHIAGGGMNGQDVEFMHEQYYHHGPFHLASGSLHDAITAYRTHGDPKNPCIVFPTCFGGRLEDQSYFVGEGKTLDTSKYFVVTFGLFSGGESSSPSNTPAPFNGPHFPQVSYEDNMRAQCIVLTRHLGIKKVYCAVGFSMGGQTAYYWALMYPDIVERFVAICGSARTSPHNKCFIEGPKSALLASRGFESGNYLVNPDIGVRAFARAYSAWAYSQTWFREHQYLYDGKYKDLESWLKSDWEAGMLTWDANDLVTLANTWSAGDISLVRDGGNYEQALKSIKVKGLVMPSKTDLYFPPEDSEIEVSHLPNAKLVILDSIWGHVAGGGSNDRDMKFMHEQITAFLSS
ncbi:hypothetical protein M422DRAFT_74514 [Sphaerobolus stellatus SS14]|nr:hypothetical protein M422DRAFT_74514 [Sphaerobolus stellatus SS14]